MSMNIEATKQALQDVHEQILALKAPELSIKTLIGYRLIGVIRSFEPLYREYERRVHYFENLLNEGTYSSLIESVHQDMQKLSSLIEKEKLPQTKDFFEMPSTDKPSGVQSMKLPELVDWLVSDKWMKLKRSNEPSRRGSVWYKNGETYRQYKTVRELLKRARTAQAIKPKGTDLAQSVDDQCEKIIELLYEQWDKQCIYAFEYLDFFSKDKEERMIAISVLDDNWYRVVQNTVDHVCLELMEFLNTMSANEIDNIATSELDKRHWLKCGNSDVELSLETEEVRVRDGSPISCKTSKQEQQRSRAKGFRVLQIFLNGTTQLPLQRIIKQLSAGSSKEIKPNSASKYLTCGKKLLKEIGSEYSLTKGTGGKPIVLTKNKVDF